MSLSPLTNARNVKRTNNLKRHLKFKCLLYIILYANIFAEIAQLVEQLIRNEQVACSSHVFSSKPPIFTGGFTIAYLVKV